MKRILGFVTIFVLLHSSHAFPSQRSRDRDLSDLNLYAQNKRNLQQRYNLWLRQWYRCHPYYAYPYTCNRPPSASYTY